MHNKGSINNTSLYHKIKAIYNPIRKDPIFAAKKLANSFKVDILRVQTPVLGIIACFPKSGSTFLMKLLCEVIEIPRVILVPHMGPNEQDINEALLKKYIFKGGISQQHVKGTANNIRIIKEYNLKPIILYRNIYDVVISLNDHINGGGPLMPTGFEPHDFKNWSLDDQLFFLIRIHLPWYFNFLLSWEEAQKAMPTHWVSYETLTQNPLKAVSDILNYWNINDIDSNKIQTGIDFVTNGKVETRLNKGVIGRGDMLSIAHKNAIEELAQASKLSKRAKFLLGITK